MKINGNDLNKYDIVAAQDETTLTAAAELRHYLEKYFGYVKEDGESECTIRLGCPEDEILAEEARSSFKASDSFAVITHGKILDIFGQTPQGTLFGMYHFLNLLGVDWLTPDQEIFTGNTDINFVSDLKYDFSAGLRINYSYGTIYDDKFRARHRLKFTWGDENHRPRSFGGLQGVEYAFDWGLFGHTFEWFVPYEEYYETHPEYFSFASTRVGDKGYNQICLTNPDVYEIVRKKTLKYLDEHPDCKILSISQNDAYGDFENNYCKCANCIEVMRKEGGFSGVLISFINRIAEEVEKKHPGVLIHTFAYKFGRRPPKHIVPRDNVLIQLCLNKPFNKTFYDEYDLCVKEREYFESWKKISKNVYVWTYLCHFENYFVPLPNFKSLYYDTVFLLRRNVYGIFQQGNADDFPFAFYELRCYLVSKLFQFPESSYEDYLGYMKKFTLGYYGRESGEYIYEYILYLENLFDVPRGRLGSRNSDFDELRYPSFIEYGKKLWEKAVECASGDVFKKRVKDAEIQFDYAYLTYLYYDFSDDDGKMAEYVEKRKELLERAFSHRGELIVGEQFKINNIDKFDYASAPSVYRNVLKKAFVRSGEFSEEYYSDENTDESVKDFRFAYRMRRNGNKLEFFVEVFGKSDVFVKDNIDDWEQDSVEMFFSESDHKTSLLQEGDFRVRVNAIGNYSCSSAEKNITDFRFERTKRGYRFNISIPFSSSVLGGGVIGFEIVAHNCNKDGYVNTVYWNSMKKSALMYYPKCTGELIIGK
ncbi:MAG: DUF4838 domain-containing protein [Clostridia bacterium]|nr:DUF4838 domain-containing protein [Clostridia bacterium]